MRGLRPPLPGWPPVRRGLLLTLLGLAAAACTASSSQVAPPQYDPYFPTGVAISPDEKWLFVVSANADLAWDSGTVQVVDLDKLEVAMAPGGTCTDDSTRPGARLCQTSSGSASTPAPFMVEQASTKIGNFAVAAVTQQLDDGRIRLFVTVRGDPSVTWMDFDPAVGTMDCGGTGSFARCDHAHRLDSLRNDSSLGALPEEPFSLDVDGVGQHVFVGHLTTGDVSLVYAPRDGATAPEITDTIGALFAANAYSGLVGAGGVGVRRPGADPSPLVYIGGRYEARVATVAVARPPGGSDALADQLIRGPYFYYQGMQAPQASGDTRAVRFSADGSRAYVLSRTPPSLMAYDTADGPDGMPNHRLDNSAEVCGQPATLAVADFGAGPRALVPCFANGQLWVFDADTLDLLDTADVGRGPNGLAVAPVRGRVYIANYAEDTIAVIDAVPGSPDSFQAIARLGQPRTTGK